MKNGSSLRVILPVFILLVAIVATGCRPGAEESLPLSSVIGSEQMSERTGSRFTAQPVQKTTIEEVESRVSLAAETDPTSPDVLSAEAGNYMLPVTDSSDLPGNEALNPVNSLDDSFMPDTYLRSLVRGIQDLNSLDGDLSDDLLNLLNTNAVTSSSDNSDDGDGIGPDSDDDSDDIDDSDSIDDNSNDDVDDDWSCEDAGDDDSEDGDDDSNHDDDHGEDDDHGDCDHDDDDGDDDEDDDDYNDDDDDQEDDD